MVLDAHHFLRDVRFNEVSVGPEPYWHRPIIITGMSARPGDVIGLMKLKPEHPEDDVIDHDLILVWGTQKRIITGADLGTAPEWNHHTGSQTELKGNDAEQCVRCTFGAWEVESSSNRRGNRLFLAPVEAGPAIWRRHRSGKTNVRNPT